MEKFDVQKLNKLNSSMHAISPIWMKLTCVKM